MNFTSSSDNADEAIVITLTIDEWKWGKKVNHGKKKDKFE